MSDNKRTPLYSWHSLQNARFVPFSGWEMPIQYTTILQEHLNVRKNAGIFDVSHMGEISVQGKDATAFLSYLLPNDVTTLKPGKALYTPLCYPNGTVVDDLIVYQRSPENYLLCVNAANTSKDLAWISQNAESFNCNIVDQSHQYAQIAIQGPKAVDLCSTAFGESLRTIPRFHFIEIEDDLWSRTGYTGEDGLEWYGSPEKVTTIVEKLNALSDPFGVAPTGLGARDSLRLEAGLPLYGHELSEKITPLEAGLGWTIKFSSQRDFIGKALLLEQKKEGINQQVIFFTLSDRRIARSGTKVFAGRNTIGEVLSGTYSPCLEKPIGSALVKTSYLSESLTVEIRGKHLPLRPQKPPLHR